METIQPIPARIVKRAKELGIKRFTLQFSGGNDEGYLNVEYDMPDPGYDNKFNRMVEDWAWSAYEYSGAGDGSEYGDNICYNLEENRASTSEWYTSRVDGSSKSMPLPVDESEE